MERLQKWRNYGKKLWPSTYKLVFFFLFANELTRKLYKQPMCLDARGPPKLFLTPALQNYCYKLMSRPSIDFDQKNKTDQKLFLHKLPSPARDPTSIWYIIQLYTQHNPCTSSPHFPHQARSNDRRRDGELAEISAQTVRPRRASERKDEARRVDHPSLHSRFVISLSLSLPLFPTQLKLSS